jgi:hypothetical protein
MKHRILLLFLIATLFAFTATERKSVPATVDLVEGVPFFIYATPTAKYEIVGKAMSMGGIIKITVNETATLNEKAIAFVKSAYERVEKGKTARFDALLLDLDKEKAHAIKFTESVSREANVVSYEGVPVYLFATPNAEYDVVANFKADYSVRAANGLLLDKIKSMVRRVLKKEENGEVGHFDALLINAEDMSETLIKFK